MAFANLTQPAPSVMDNGLSLAGMLLVATPMLGGTLFGQSLIYICSHTPDGGAMGLVINKRLPRPDFDDLLEQLQIEPVPPARRIGLCAGGPVEEGHGLVLHSAEWSGQDSLRITDNVALTSSMDVLQDIAQGGGPQDALLAMGHAGWAAGQLEQEILQHDAWLVVPATRELIFGMDHTVKWRRALASINIDPARLSGQTGHA
ncbi:YqgE/AlgH family protein [Acetobacter sp. LMG 32666]|uniref:YqgE/AlgH family protein n=1 Tax=Acetobacter sp. LMG 32666 TaxID=2959295 RepID=UPI0030C80E63